MRTLCVSSLHRMFLIPSMLCLITAAASSAHAGVVALSQLEIFGFQVDTGDALVSFSNIRSPGSDGISGSIANNPDVRFNHVNDAPLACVGQCSTIGENNFVKQYTGSFTRADSLVLGTDFLAGNGGFQLIAEIRDFDAAGRDAFGIFDLAATFVLSRAAPLTISFFADVYREVQVGSAFTFALADSSLSIDVAGFGWAPKDPFAVAPLNLIQATAGSTSYNPTDDGIGGNSGFFSTTTGVLGPDSAYNLTIRATVRATSHGQEIPEPSTVGLLIMGLAGLAFARRKLKT